MAVLSRSQRNKLTSSSFALPGKRSFPIQDKIHAEKALELVGRSVRAGNTTPAQASTVRRKAKAELHEAGGAIRG